MSPPEAPPRVRMLTLPAARMAGTRTLPVLVTVLRIVASRLSICELPTMSVPAVFTLMSALPLGVETSITVTSVM